MKRIVSTLIAVGCLVVTTGCLDIEQNLTIERNLSGKAGFNMKMDMEPMIPMLLMFTRSMEGKTGEPTAAELAKAKDEFMKDMKKDVTGDFDKDRKAMEASLPKGVTLLEATGKDEGLKFAANLLFGVDNITKLSEIAFPKKDTGGMPAPGNPVEKPFEDLKVVDEGATVLVTSAAKNPMADDMPPGGGPGADAAMTKMVTDMVKGLRVAFKITSPMTVVESNHHRKEGNTLIWEYNLASLEKLTPAQQKEGIKVRFRK